jgi:hypothetical protein
MEPPDAPPGAFEHCSREIDMDINPSSQPPPTGGVIAGAKRSIAMALLAIGVLVVGGSAVAFAADPSPSASPAATNTPATGDDGTTAVPEITPGTDSSGDARPGRGAHGDCPDDGSTDGPSGGSSSSGSDPTPDATTVPAPSLDPSDV